MNGTARGTGRTTRSLQEALKVVLEGPKPNLALYVVPHTRFDDYCFRIVARLAREQIEKYSMANRMVLFKNGGRMRFATHNDPYLDQMGNWKWRYRGYRSDTPIIWDHAAMDSWSVARAAREAAGLKK